MYPQLKHAGIAGILAGIALAGELTFFMTSGWSPEKFADPVAALNLLESGGQHLRIAAVLGFAGLALTALFVAGLASRLSRDAPTLAAATLYFGLLGIAGHSLVPLSLWTGIPAFLAIAESNGAVAQEGWTAFRIVLDGAQGIGSFFMGLSMLATGLAAIRERLLPVPLAWVALVAGAATVLTLLVPLSGFAAIAIFPALLLTIVFRFWAGNVLRTLRHVERSIREPTTVRSN